MIKGDILLTQEERFLLAHAILEQNYAIEIVSSYVSDIEQGHKAADVDLYKKYLKLYDKLKAAGE